MFNESKVEVVIRKEEPRDKRLQVPRSLKA